MRFLPRPFMVTKRYGYCGMTPPLTYVPGFATRVENFDRVPSNWEG